MKLRTLLGLLALLPFLALRAAEADGLSIESTSGGDLEYDPRTGQATYRDGVIVKYGDSVLTADRVKIDRVTGEVAAEGNVVLVREGGSLWRGDRLFYNFKTRVIGGNDFRTGQQPYFATGDAVITNPTNHTYSATNAYFTTDDHPEPDYRIRAKRIVVVPGRFIEARQAILYLGSVPVFYFPVFRKSLDRHPNNFEFTPGFRSSWGPYLLSSYNWYASEHLHGSLNLDLRAGRGVGGGPDLWFGRPGIGQFDLKYWAGHDEDPRSRSGYDRTPEDRQRFTGTYQNSPRTNLTLKGVAAYQSDPLVLRDFFESEFHGNVQPKTFFEANQSWPNWSLNLLTQPRVNDYQETIERLPELKLTGLRQQVGPTPVYYESESSVGYYRHLFPDVNTNRWYPVEPPAYAAMRADTYHQFLVPWTFFGWLNVAPRVGQRLSYYSEADGRGSTTGEEDRTVFNTGAEVSWKASRVYRSAQNDLFEVNGLRHIIEPSANYVFIPDPDGRPRQLPQFDSQLPSSRLLPLDYPEYNAIDAIDSQQAIRFGVRNKLQTKREDGLQNLVNWNVFFDWHLTRHHKRENYSDVYSDLDFRPRSWLTINSETRHNIDRGQFREANHLLTLHPEPDWSVQVGHRYRDKSPDLGIGNNLIISSIYYRLDQNWGARVSHHFEARDGVMEYQYYTLYRDFRSWTSALTFRVRDNRSGNEDYTVALMLSLKASPRFGIRGDSDHPQYLLGR
jgi:lipopolysaccharide assembly outer membrane protein LptD (OstA)